jgi:hypothetical protein
MLRSVAVARIQDQLGFMTGQSDKVIARLQEAQRDLENGKTLPKFLLQENQALTLTAGESTVVLPALFLRPDDNNKLHYIIAGEDKPTYIEWERDFNLAFELYYTTTPSAPVVAHLRNLVIDFIRPADATYTIGWSYYKRGDPLTTDVENEWLEETRGAPEWLIGEAGWRLAKDKRDKDAIASFDQMRTQGRAACFGEILARDDSTGPIYMGSQL